MAKLLALNCLTGEATVTDANKNASSYPPANPEDSAYIRIEQNEANKASAKVKLQAAEYTPLTEAEADTIVL